MRPCRQEDVIAVMSRGNNVQTLLECDRWQNGIVHSSTSVCFSSGTAACAWGDEWTTECVQASGGVIQRRFRGRACGSRARMVGEASLKSRQVRAKLVSWIMGVVASKSNWTDVPWPAGTKLSSHGASPEIARHT